MNRPDLPPGLRIIGGLEDAHRYARGEITAKTHRVHVRPISIDRMAQATRDHGMQDALDDKALQRIRERVYGKARHIRVPPSWFAQIAADVREFWNEVVDAPAHHATYALIVVISWSVLFVAPIVVMGWVK